MKQRRRGNLRDRSAPSLDFIRKALSCFGVGADDLRAHGRGLGQRGNLRGARHRDGELKVHINHIYSKLQATSRVEAIRRGKEMQGKVGTTDRTRRVGGSRYRFRKRSYVYNRIYNRG
ncbi:hypothetical protein [Paenibacillus sp.]|uniref:hypothetical protein n=1 Tax=Paenibacillus sp. TaxID=58172 RepID=UPI00281240C5|nr:hypothetical protein [Paenibacillus sp.]